MKTVENAKKNKSKLTIVKNKTPQKIVNIFFVSFVFQSSCFVFRRTLCNVRSIPNEQTCRIDSMSLNIDYKVSSCFVHFVASFPHPSTLRTMLQRLVYLLHLVYPGYSSLLSIVIFLATVKD